MTNYYKILGVDRSASSEEIKKAYRKLSLKFHPDKNNGDPFFENMFKQIQEAYEVLSDPNQRATFNRKYENRNTGQHSHTNSRTNLEPRIDSFRVSRITFFSGEEISFEWRTTNADIVEIIPFGRVNSSGFKTFRINNFHKQYMTVELRATNSRSQRFVSRKIRIENKNFHHSSYQSTQKKPTSDNSQRRYNNPTSNNQSHESFWSGKGRLRRSQYFIRTLLLSAPMAIFYLDDDAMMGFGLIYSIFAWITIAIQTVKRLHDINLSGWWYLIFFIPYVNLIFGLCLLIIDGNRGPNNYGPDPKNR